MTCATDKGLVISVPWPIRLFGDMQDILGLPAVVVAADVRTAIGVTLREDEAWSIKMPGAAEAFVIDPLAEAAEIPQSPALARALRGLKSRRVSLRGGYNFQVLTRAPWTARVADSPALVVAWTVVLLELHGLLTHLSGNEVAGFALAAQQDEPPQQRMSPEIFAATLGGTVMVESRDEPKCKAFERILPGLVLGLAGEGDDSGALQHSVREMLQALLRMKQSWSAFDARSSTVEDAVGRLNGLSDRDTGLVYGQLRKRDICRDAIEIMESEGGFDDDRIAELLDSEHEMLRDYFGFKYEQVERLMAAAMGAGCLGCKIIPGFNAFVCFASDRQAGVVKAIRQAGGEARAIAVSDGMRVQHLHEAGEACEHKL